MIEATIDDGETPQWLYGQIHLALKELYDSYRPKSRLDRIQLDIDKLTIKMAVGEHSDVLFEKAMMVRKKYWRRRTKLTWDELISCVVTGASSAYQTAFTTKMLEMDQEPNGQVVLTALKKLDNELYLVGSISRTNVESAHETSLIQFNKKKTTDQWTSGMQCYWCWKLGHKSSDCKRKAAGEPKLPKPGSKITAAPGGGGSGGGSKTQAPCGRCKGKHLTKNCYHDPANATKRPTGWIVKTKDQKDVGSVAINSDSSDSFVKVHKPNFLIIAIE
jgi:hypothetical protein